MEVGGQEYEVSTMYQIVCYQLVPVPLDENLPWKSAGPGRPAGQVETWNPEAIAMVTGANHSDFIQDGNSLRSPNLGAIKGNSPECPRIPRCPRHQPPEQPILSRQLQYLHEAGF